MDYSDNNTESDENNWMSVSDLMAGLMVIFLFIGVSTVYVSRHKEIQEKSHLEANKKHLCEQLRGENFGKNAIICPDAEATEAIIEFHSDVVGFDKNKATIKKELVKGLENIFDKFTRFLEKNGGSIDGVKVEGRADQCRFRNKTVLGSYALNTKLSQDRAYAVMVALFKHIDGISPISQRSNDKSFEKWLTTRVTASGISNSKASNNKHSPPSQNPESIKKSDLDCSKTNEQARAAERTVKFLVKPSSTARTQKQGEKIGGADNNQDNENSN